MALADDVQNRFTTQELVELTNPNAPTATTVNTTFLGYAVSDVEAEFITQQIGTYDSTDAQHVSVGVDGVRARLKYFARSGGIGGSKNAEWDDWREKRAEPLSKSFNRRRIDPSTSTETTPSDELPSGVTTRRPWSDSERFHDFQVRSPYGTDRDDDQ